MTRNAPHSPYRDGSLLVFSFLAVVVGVAAGVVGATFRFALEQADRLRTQMVSFSERLRRDWLSSDHRCIASIGIGREPQDGRGREALSRAQHGGGKARLVRRVGEPLGLEAEPVALPISPPGRPQERAGACAMPKA